jgi:hypothetical protein
MLAEKFIERYGFDTGGDVPADGGLAAVLGRATQRRFRLPPSVVVHWDRYDDGNLGDEIDAYDQRRHERRPIPPSRQQDVERHGEAAFYGWSENAARQLSHPERAEFREFMKGHGFDLA